MSHTPGRGHGRKSEPKKKQRFKKNAAWKKAERQKAYDHAIERWHAMTEEQKNLLPELHPDNFKP